MIHTVGPIWQGGTSGEARLLASCYRRCLEVADELGAASIAFPAISTGAYRYPVAEATRIAVETVRTTISSVQLVRFVCFDPAVHERYERELAVARSRGERSAGAAAHARCSRKSTST